MGNWTKYKLSELGEIVGGATPSTSRDDFYGGDIPWITPKDLSSFNERYIGGGERNITEAGYKSCSAKILPKGSVLFTSRAPIGYVAIAANDICTNQGFKSIIPNGGKIDNHFLYYLLKFYKDNIESMGSGTTFKEVSGATMKNIEVSCPPLDEQKRIADVLSSLDDKIELNNRINANLEQQAQAIFKSWFVDFDPFRGDGLVGSELGIIPKGWRVGLLGDLVHVRYGKDHKKLLDGSIPVYGSGGIMRYANQALYDKESILIPRKGTLNNVFYIDEPFWSVDTMFFTEMKYANVAKYIYFFLVNKNLASMNAGSAVPSMTTEILNNLKIVVPSEKDLKRYDILVAPMFQDITENIRCNTVLSNLRDTLLPKLMSGELSVEEAERQL